MERTLKSSIVGYHLFGSAGASLTTSNSVRSENHFMKHQYVIKYEYALRALRMKTFGDCVLESRGT